jgi:benzoyl-CoA reductase/2-hydroxyglutaryl-CoA dehydratase subunit BcrC/BadD/HgdB
VSCRRVLRACFTPNDERVPDFADATCAVRADGVIHYSLAFCQTYEAQATKIEKTLRKNGILVLCLSSDFSSNDWIKPPTRTQAFVQQPKNCE